MNNLRYAEVCVTHSYNKDAFTYSIPEALRNQLAIGSLVSVPFGKQKYPGIVLSLSDKTSFRTKDIISLDRPYPVLTSKQIQLIEWMSKYFYSPTPLCLVHFLLPSFPKNLDTVLYKSIQKLILIPTPNFALERDILGQTDLPIYHHKLSSREKQKVWSRVYTGNECVVVGTRSALFLPYRNLKEIQVLDAQSEYYAEKRSPLYNANQIASKLASYFEAKLSLSYSEDFREELKERKELGLPPYKDLLCLSPLKPNARSISESQRILIELRQLVQAQNLDIELYRSQKDTKTPEIFLKGTKLHDFIPAPPKGWKIQVYFTNIS